LRRTVIPAKGALKILACAVACLPWRWLRLAGGALGLLAGSVVRVRRAHVENAMRRTGLTEVPVVARAMYASLGTAIFEFLWLVGKRTAPRRALLLSERAQAVLASHGRESRTARSPGLVVATAHTGNWDFVACALARDHIDLTVVTKRLSAPTLDAFWQERRRSFGVELLHGAGVFGRAIEAIGRGRAVAVLIDQVPERRSAMMEISFLGQSARCDTTPALLAARTGAPLVLALSRRLHDGTHWIDVPLTLEPPPRASRLWIEEATRALNGALERFVLEHPSQWLWMHRRWKTSVELGLMGRRPVADPDGRGETPPPLAGTEPVC
jgi:Kdo2-lipid IVA lauroyltransferase/acyltransferase